MNLKTAARRLGVHYQTAYRWVRSGQLLAVKVGSGYEISEAALERFAAQRTATERFPDRAPAAAPLLPAAFTRGEVLRTLDVMVNAVTTDPRAVEARAARMTADVLGDAALVYGRDDSGEVALMYAAHRDPESEVNAFTIARDARSATDFVHHVIRSGEQVFVPQVPQRALRRRLHPERHMHVMRAGCYSAICVPIGTDGAVFVSRDVPGHPYVRDDVEFVAAVAQRVDRSRVRAERWNRALARRHAVVAECERVLDESSTAAALAPGRLAHLLDTLTEDDPQSPVAICDLALGHLACTKEYAVVIGADPTHIVGEALATFVPDLALVQPVLDGELDSRSEDLDLADVRRRVTFHVEMVRGSDATPWGVVIVTHPVADATAV